MNYLNLKKSKNAWMFALVLFMFSCNETVKISEGEVDNEGVAIAYSDCGTGDTTLLFVHGWCIDQSYWASQVTYFCPKYRVVTIDLPGHGKSGSNRTEWSIAAFGDDVAEVIRKLELEQVILIGHSMSGNVNLEAALQLPKPVIGFIGIDNFKQLGAEYAAEEVAGIDDFLASMEADFEGVTYHYAEESLFPSFADTAVVRKVATDMSKANAKMAVPTLRSLMAYNVIERNQMPMLKHKLVLVNSDNFPTDTDLLHKYAGKFEVIDMHGTGHYPMLENPEEFNKRLQEAIWKTE